MVYEKLVKFFKLEEKPDLIEVATKPKSCGGGKEFKKLALQGDYLINQALLAMHPEIKDVGKQTKLKTDFHNRRTLVKLGEKLGIDEAIGSHKLGHIPSENEIKEAVESLLGVSHKLNELEDIFKIVEELYKIAKEMGYLDINYKGQLNEHLQKLQEELPTYSCKRKGGRDHKPIWQCTINCTIRKEEMKAKSELFAVKKDAEQNAAFKILKRLGLEIEENFPVEEQQLETIMKEATQSKSAKIITFSKTADMFGEGEFPVTKRKNETYATWAARKVKSKPYYTLIQLSTLYDDISGATWSATMEDGTEIILIHLELGRDEFYEVGHGPSKTKARKLTALKIIESSNLYNWLKKNG